MNWVAARLQKASSQSQSSRIAFSQFMAAFQGMPKLKQASARFLQKQCFWRYLRHFSSTRMAQEYLPSLFRAAALLLCRCKVISNYQGLSSSLSRMLSQTYKHYLARWLYKQRKDKYQAAERLSGEYLRAALRSSIALQLFDLRASQKRSNEFFSFLQSRNTQSSFDQALTGCQGGLSLIYTLISCQLLFQTAFSTIPKPPPLCFSIFLLFLKIGDWISSMTCLFSLPMGILTILFVTVSNSYEAFEMVGGAGIMLLINSATLMPILGKSTSKKFPYDSLLEEISDLSYLQLADISLLIGLYSTFSWFSLAVLLSSTVYAFSSDFQLYFDENTAYKIVFFFNYSSFSSFSFYFSFYLPPVPNFLSTISQSMDDLLRLNLLARSCAVQLAYLSGTYILGSSKFGANNALTLLPLSVVLSFLLTASFISSLFGVDPFYLALSSLPNLFFINEDYLITSIFEELSFFSKPAYFDDCLNSD